MEREAFASFVRRLSGDDRESRVKGRRGRSGLHHGRRTSIVLDDNFVADAQMIS